MDNLRITRILFQDMALDEHGDMALAKPSKGKKKSPSGSGKKGDGEETVEKEPENNPDKPPVTGK